MSEDGKLALDLFRKMYLLRHFDAEAAAAYGRKEIHGTYRGARGQEAVSVGICHALDDKDVIYPGLRGIGDVLAKGTEPRLLMAELFAKATGLSAGKGGALHLADPKHGVMGVFGVMAAPVPLATGNALAAKMLKNGVATVCLFGDRATNEGVFHESLNIAALWKLPILYAGVNNAPEDAELPLSEHTAARSLAALAQVHGIKTAVIDATDVFNVYRHAKKVVQELRSGDGPFFIECKCYPLDEPSHAETEKLVGEMRKTGKYTGFLMFKKSMIGRIDLSPPQAWKEGDPLTKLESTILLEKMADEAELERVRAEVAVIVKDAIEFARNSPEPSLSSAVQGVYTD